MIVSLEEFNTYTENFDDNTQVVNMKNEMLQTAQEIVSEHLGYSVEVQTYDQYLSGIGTAELALYGKPIVRVNSLQISGSDVPSDSYAIDDRFLRLSDGVWPVGVGNVHVNYDAGWTEETVPSLVKSTIKQIASLLLQESGGNIGITGKSMSENSRTYINYTNFNKWLDKLNPLVVMRLV